METIQVLLVEDNVVDAQTVQELLTQSDHPSFELTLADQLNHAANAVLTMAYDVILLDLSLPDEDGTASVEFLQVAHPDTPIVVLTGTQDDSLAQDAVQKGAQDYLVKGRIDEEILSRTLRYAIERKRLQLELTAVQKLVQRIEAYEELQQITQGAADELSSGLKSMSQHLDDLIEKLTKLNMDSAILAQHKAMRQLAQLMDERLDAMNVSIKRAVSL